MTGTASYWDDSYYKTDAFKEKVRAAEKQEKSRRQLISGIANKETLSYARYLSACANDATLNGEIGFKPCDDDVLRDWPFLSAAMEDK